MKKYKHRIRARVRAKEYYQENKDSIKNKTLLRRYGVSNAQYNEMFNKQKGCCEICKRHQSQFKKALFVDHNHITK